MEVCSGLVFVYIIMIVSMVLYFMVMGVVGGGGIGDFVVCVGY